jgi:hypothetical protein
MPNWCENVVFIEHKSRKLIQKLYIEFDDGNIIQKYLPIPERLTEIQTNKWCNENWGTKFDIDSACVNIHTRSRIQVNFLSAWNPPNKFYKHLRSLGFTVHALYCEPGSGFCGQDTADDDIVYDMSDAPEIIQRYFSEHFA